eukprot:m.41208 g.41208  ORF g.41208 m.41208 type:complete len:414 (+) comp6985_c1_seq1:44-1285(+)
MDCDRRCCRCRCCLVGSCGVSSPCSVCSWQCCHHIGVMATKGEKRKCPVKKKEKVENGMRNSFASSKSSHQNYNSMSNATRSSNPNQFKVIRHHHHQQQQRQNYPHQFHYRSLHNQSDHVPQTRTPEELAEWSMLITKQQRERKQRKLKQFHSGVVKRLGDFEEVKRQTMLDFCQRGVDEDAKVLHANSDYHDCVAQNKKVISPLENASMLDPSPYSQHSNVAFEQSSIISDHITYARSLLLTRRDMTPIDERLPGGTWNREKRLTEALHAIESQRFVNMPTCPISSHENEGEVDRTALNASSSSSISNTSSSSLPQPSLSLYQSYNDYDNPLTDTRTRKLLDMFRNSCEYQEEEKRRQGFQRKMYRKLFMDQERACVRAYRQQRHHSAKVDEMKRIRENARKAVQDAIERGL